MTSYIINEKRQRKVWLLSYEYDSSVKYLAVCENWILVLSLQKIRAVLKINIDFWKQYTEQFQLIIHI